ncbi:splicing factor Cactin-like [Sycon ciliatum]|uniref:splicing factor Cactin-like n=1 Tax=Sycon ciliatum TaxID=27933 RepID=UPI0020A90CA8|eukprot:scpid55983/ scgid7874/ Uncharacterized protein C19orf29; Cactin; Renal carcinoma antigen NY-REN-24
MDETASEKRERRLRKKEEKERKKREKIGWDKELMGYTNQDNPFGDGNLLDPFVWHKKREQDGYGHLDAELQSEKDKHRILENRRELEKVKQRRQERELEQAAREEEMQMMQREREAEMFKEWEAQEDTFHLEQAKLRSKIRMRDGRSKPIDLLAKYADSMWEMSEEALDEVDVNEPYTVLNGLAEQDLEDLLEDIKVYVELEEGKNLDFWKDITTIVEEEIRKLHDAAKEENQRQVVNRSVKGDVSAVFQGKSYKQLNLLKQQIARKIGAKEGDISYWEHLHNQLNAVMAKARLRENHQKVLQMRLEQLRSRQLEELYVAPSDMGAGEGEDDDGEKKDGSTAAGRRPATGDQAADDDEGLDYDAVMYSPKFVPASEAEASLSIVDEMADQQMIAEARHEVAANANSSKQEEEHMRHTASRDMEPGEATFNVQVPVENTSFLWQSKYRPRKPRFFNRVHCGFEWNKYNQTHYGHDNPPPKVVHGYKFNIFYPDLIDKRKAPEYKVLQSEEGKDFCVIRFHAGPPYEDIAFKIVNREWEFSRKHGFRCQFRNGVFQLHFRYRRQFYRR